MIGLVALAVMVYVLRDAQVMGMRPLGFFLGLAGGYAAEFVWVLATSSPRRGTFRILAGLLGPLGGIPLMLISAPFGAAYFGGAGVSLCLCSSVGLLSKGTAPH